MSNQRRRGKQCAAEEQSRQSLGILRTTLDHFVTRAQSVHGNEYDYTLTSWRGAHSLVEILCRTHGTFSQRPMNHLAGNGCPACVTRNFTQAQNAWLDTLNVTMR